MPSAQRIRNGFKLSLRIAIPTTCSDGTFILGDRVVLRRFRSEGGGIGARGTVVAINLAAWEMEYGWELRPYQVLLDGNPRRLYRFGANDLALAE